ncbi:hypothetical protein [Cohnella hashimotonis]|uniref:Uncharacterized protein n=1 Tax=Cohnella hashimotonis TaxID=2826895 RepID=A0ABT6TTS8_9BACL|nr:hypothetical protein [Cohnella hashimotonis]MDI4649583.1 hypothetical protein [Cohnella hashimotonis]
MRSISTWQDNKDLGRDETAAALTDHIAEFFVFNPRKNYPEKIVTLNG